MSVTKKSKNPRGIFEKWCTENHMDATFSFPGTERGKKVKCELTLSGCKYVGIGISKSKKSAKKKATEDYVSFLARQHLLSTPKKANAHGNSEVEPPAKTEQKIDTDGNFEEEPPAEIEKKTNSHENSEVEPPVETEKLDDLSVNQICGNWTASAAKKRLKRFIKSNSQNIYTTNCAYVKKKHIVEMSMFIEKLNKTVNASKSGMSKKVVTERCTLSLVSQLCELGVIENHFIAQKKKEKTHLTYKKEHNVNVNEKLANEVYSLLEDLDIKPVTINDTNIIEGRKISLIIDKVTDSPNNMIIYSAPRIIAWCPPKSNWNAWLGCVISRPRSLKNISRIIAKQYAEKLKFSFAYQKRIKDRSKLPIFNKKDEILDVINSNSVVIIQGSTGCGKTTQVCQFILDDYVSKNQGASCNIICTQPRKVSAVSLSSRVAFERAEDIGKSVGYTIRFKSIDPQPFGAILFCTTEILIRKLRRGLLGISHVIIDEVHERHADTDFLLIILKDIVQKFPNLKLILMSANANLEVFQKYFNNCPVVDAHGRCYPVKEYYLEDIVQLLDYKPIAEKKPARKKMYEELDNCNLIVSNDYPVDIRSRVAMINEDSYHFEIIKSLLTYIEADLKKIGGVLIFLPGWAWILELQSYLLQNKFFEEKCCILLLHSSLSQTEQQKVFKPAPPGKRKVILSTNIAETSITIDDVVFVIDYGKAKVVKFFNNVTNYLTVWASKVNVEQRKGRAGRVKEGFCFHLYTKERFQRMDDNISPELVRSPLTRIGLTIKFLKLGDIHRFLSKAIDPPPIEAMNDVVSMLNDMKCLKASGDLTVLGFILAQLPVEPQLGRMMILGNIFLLGNFLSIIAAGSSTDYDLFSWDDVQNTVKHHFSGNYPSDQLAFLNAFIQWDSTYQNNNNDTNYLEDYNLSSSSLLNIYNIKEQIINKFLYFGFPECCFKTENFDFDKNEIFDDPQLDMIPALLTMAFYPNIYCHKENRKINLNSTERAAVCKSSINIPKRGCGEFQLPFFVFEQQVHAMCKHSTMVTPIHLLLFGARKIEYYDRLIVLDNWINLKMDVKIAAAIVALRPAIEDIIVRTVKNPKLILKFNKTDIKLINTLKKLCTFNAGRDNLSPITFDKRDDKS